jgi:hypothetical protein
MDTIGTEAIAAAATASPLQAEYGIPPMPAPALELRSAGTVIGREITAASSAPGRRRRRR